MGLAKRFEEQASILREKYEIVSLVPEEVEQAYKERISDFKRNKLAAPRVEITEAYKKGKNDGESIDFTKRAIKA